MSVVGDQIVDPDVAASLTEDESRDHGLVGWIVVRDQPRPGEFLARLVAIMPTPYVIPAPSLDELRTRMPPGLRRSDRQPCDPPDLEEIWFLE